MSDYAPHNDLPELNCSLNRAEWCKRIAQQIILSSPPKTIALHGTWGMGKTSVLAQLDYLISGSSNYKKGNCDIQPLDSKAKKLKIKTVWFEAWQYQREDNIVAALLKEIREQLTLPSKILNQLKEDVIIGTYSLLQSLEFEFSAFGQKLGIKNVMGNIDNSTVALQKEKFSQPLPSFTIKKLLEKAIDQLLKIDKQKEEEGWDYKLVVFIDDLDRCEPDVAFKVLESIKIYLNLNNCVFVLGMDQEAIEIIIARHYEKQLPNLRNPNDDGDLELKQLARLYLEKICQDIYHLPILTTKAKSDYFLSLINIDKENKEKLAPLLVKFNLLPPIPRSIKIYANIVMLFFHTQVKGHPKSLDDNNLKLLLILSYLYSFHYEIYQLIFRYPGFYVDEFLRYCREGYSDHDVFKNMQLPILTAQEESAGETPTTGYQSQMINQYKYPHKNLRHVLWVRELTTHLGPVEENVLNELKV